MYRQASTGDAYTEASHAYRYFRELLILRAQRLCKAPERAGYIFTCLHACERQGETSFLGEGIFSHALFPF